MARNRSRKRRSNPNFTVINDSEIITLLTLADDTVLAQDSQLTLTQDIKCISADVLASIRGLTSGNGPIEFGWASTELTVGEILEKLVAQPTSQFDYPAIEHNKRPVGLLGTFVGDQAGDTEELNDNVPIRFRFYGPTRIPAGKNMPKFWVRNRSGAPLDTGGIVEMSIKYYCVWQ